MYRSKERQYSLGVAYFCFKIMRIYISASKIYLWTAHFFKSLRNYFLLQFTLNSAFLIPHRMISISLDSNLTLQTTFSSFLEPGLYPYDGPKYFLILHEPSITLKRYVPGSRFYDTFSLNCKTVFVIIIELCHSRK